MPLDDLIEKCLFRPMTLVRWAVWRSVRDRGLRHIVLHPSSSEWQANCFGGELLMSVDHIHLCRDSWDAMLLFGVSLEAADYQWRKYFI
jgi:hypothetical protein